MIPITNTKFLVATLLSLCGLCGSASAQDYPNQTIELMVAFQPGGGRDSRARDYETFKQLVTTLNLKAGQ